MFVSECPVVFETQSVVEAAFAPPSAMDPGYAAAQLRLRQHTVLLLNEKGLRGSQLREAVNSAATQMGLPLTAIPHDVARLVAAYSQPAAASTAAADVAARQQLAPAGAAQARNPSAQAQAASHQEQLRISMERIQRAAPVAAAAAAAAAAAGRTGSSQPPTSAELTAMRAAYLAHLNGATSGATTAAAADSMARKQKKKRKSAADAAGTAAAAAAGEPMVELEEEEDVEEGGAVVRRLAGNSVLARGEGQGGRGLACTDPAACASTGRNATWGKSYSRAWQTLPARPRAARPGAGQPYACLLAGCRARMKTRMATR